MLLMLMPACEVWISRGRMSHNNVDFKQNGFAMRPLLPKQEAT
jgi:hypothetical protein